MKFRSARAGWQSLRDSIRVRLAVWHTLTVAVLLGTFAIGTRMFLVHTIGVRADQSLADMARAFVDLWNGMGVAGEAGPARSAAAAASEFRERDRGIVVLDDAGRVIAMSNTHARWPALSPQALSRFHGSRNPQFATVEGARENGAPVRIMALPIAVGRQLFTVVALRSLHAEQEATESFDTAIMVAIPVVLILAGIGGYLLARASLAPVVAMGVQAQRISASNLHERLPVANPGDELGRLAQVLNGLLARLETSFEQQRQFMADASHELRTPVAALSSVADVVLARQDRDSRELREALEIVRGEGRRLGRLVEDLMLLARVDAGQFPVRREPLFLEELLQDSAKAARGLAAARGVTLTAAPAAEAPLMGDADLLRRLVMILLDNAIKYTPPGGEVRLSLDRAGAGAPYRISVEDTGIGIPAWAAERVFERFFRVDKSRTRAAEADGGVASTGLGLAIARWIAATHGGTVTLDATGPSGSRFVITLPEGGV